LTHRVENGTPWARGIRMKKNMIFGIAALSLAFSFSGTLANAASAKTKAFCLSFTGTELSSKRTLGTAQCDITQTMSQTELGSTWSCSFDGKSADKLQTIATWVSDGNEDQAPTIFYDIFPQEDLGGFLLKGLNMTAVNSDGAFLEVVTGSTPHAKTPDMMLMTNGFSSNYDQLSVTSIQNGSCVSQ
jgi:hypothetical protein